MMEKYDVVIVGAGPGGLTAAIHSAFEGLSTLVLSSEIGGQAAQTSRIENYPGFPQGVVGSSLMEKFQHQSSRLGVHFQIRRAISLRASSLLYEGGTVHFENCILATGLSFKPLGLSNEQSFVGHGLWYGPATRIRHSGRDVAIIGAANSAGQAAIWHARFARHVFIVSRHASLAATMSVGLIRQIEELPNIEFVGGEDVSSINGRSVLSIGLSSGRFISASAVFVCVGQSPRTEWLPPSILDPHGLIIHDDLLVRPGLYAVGDARQGAVHRVCLAAADGARAVAKILERRK